MGTMGTKNSQLDYEGTSLMNHDIYTDEDEMLEERTPSLHRLVSFREFGDEFDMTEALEEGSLLNQHNDFIRHVARVITSHIETRRSVSMESKSFDETHFLVKKWRVTNCP
jgi:hypothetical protein